ncbi:hypothetical protein BGZ96_003017 [Linnemannia gamsii]|uniref:F-box domain-containing protein n=1 Tax=Linnemannia gamsii TaxID=64522 RepID=A0ABQ7K871_9FUNG|nr:hypothetical protein BGZ96_003017 [Linnemannia gamsii]
MVLDSFMYQTPGLHRDDDEISSQHRPFCDAFPLRLKSMFTVFPTTPAIEWKHEWHASGQCQDAVNTYLTRPRDLDSLMLSSVQIEPGCLAKLAKHFSELKKLEVEFCDEIRIPEQAWRVDSGFFQYDSAGRPQFFAILPGNGPSSNVAATATALGVGNISEEGVYAVEIAVAALEVLPVVPPRCCILNDEMAAGLSAFHGLKSLILTQSDSDDSKISHFGFFRLLAGMPCLECISLTGMDIGDDLRWGSLASINDADVGPVGVEYPRLKCVQLVGTHLAPSVARLFYQALPNVLTYDNSQVDESTCSDMVLDTMVASGCADGLLSVRLALENVESQPQGQTVMSMRLLELYNEAMSDSESDYGSDDSGWGGLDDYEEDDPYAEEDFFDEEEDPISWTNLTAPTLTYFLFCIPRVECLDLAFVPLVDNSLLLLSICCTRLKTLRLAHCNAVTYGGVAHILALCPRLVYLRLEHLPKLDKLFWGPLIPGQGWGEYAPWACAQGLRQLSVIYCPLWDQQWKAPEMVALIRRRLADLKSLAILELVGSMQYLISNLAPTNSDTPDFIDPRTGLNSNGDGKSYSLPLGRGKTLTATPIPHLIYPWDYLPESMPTLWRMNWQLGKIFKVDLLKAEQFVRKQCPGLRQLRMMPVTNWEEMYYALKGEPEPVTFEH